MVGHTAVHHKDYSMHRLAEEFRIAKHFGVLTVRLVTGDKAFVAVTSTEGGPNIDIVEVQRFVQLVKRDKD